MISIVERKMLPPADLVVAEKNPNKLPPEKFRALVAEMKEFGFLDAIIARYRTDGEVEIVDGAHRRDAAIENGFPEVPVDIIAVDEARAHLLRIAFSRLRGETDLTVASEILAMLEENLQANGMKEADLLLTGLDQGEINDLLKAAATSADSMHLPDVDQDQRAGATRNTRETPTTWTVELTFTEKAVHDRVKRSLRRAAGKGHELADGMLALLDQLAEKA